MDSYTRLIAQAKPSGNQTAAIIIAAGANSNLKKQRVVIDKIIVSMSATGTFTLTSAITTGVIVPVLNILANTTIEISGFTQLKSAPGEGVDLTTVGGNTTYLIEYHYAP